MVNRNMSVFDPNLTFSGTVVGTTKTFGPFDLQGYSYIHYMAFSNVNYSITLQWSMNEGIDVDVSNNFPDSAGLTSQNTMMVKARYLSVLYTGAAGNSTLRFQLSLNSEPLPVVSLSTGLTGAKVLDSANLKIRSLQSSDTSITVTENIDNIDITVTSGTAIYSHFYSGLFTTTSPASVVVNGINPGTHITTGDFTYAAGVITYTGTETKDFLFTWTGTVRTATNSSISGAAQVRKNNVVFGGDLGICGWTIDTRYGPCVVTAIVNLATNDYLSISVASGAAVTTDVTTNNYIIRSL